MLISLYINHTYITCNTYSNFYSLFSVFLGSAVIVRKSGRFVLQFQFMGKCSKTCMYFIYTIYIFIYIYLLEISFSKSLSNILHPILLNTLIFERCCDWLNSISRTHCLCFVKRNVKQTFLEWSHSPMYMYVKCLWRRLARTGSAETGLANTCPRLG